MRVANGRGPTVMFGYFRTARRRKALTALAAEFPTALDGMHPTMLAAALILANMTLDMTSSVHGSLLRSNPAKADPEAAGAALDALVRLREGVLPLARDSKSRHRSQAACHRAASGIAALTVGLALDNSIAARRAVVLSWRVLWESRSNLSEAVLWFRSYERAAEVEAVPRKLDGAIPSDIDMIRLGKRVPAFLAAKPTPKA